MKRIPFYFLLLLILCSCQSDPGPAATDEARLDSAALHVALLPVADCFPFYLAQRSGIYERLGLELRLHTLQAQIDTDTALLRHRAELVYSDLARAIMIQQADTFDLRAIAATPAELHLISARRGRVRSLAQLRERMVAVARHSITDYWSDRLMDSARMDHDAIFRPQINDVRIRTDMICNGTMDAALLPEPFALEARLRGNSLNFSTRTLQPQLGAFLVPSRVLRDSTRMHQLRLLFEGYAEAVDALNEPHDLRDSIPALLRQLCHTPDSITDTIARAMPPFRHLRRPTQSDAQAALRWLRSRDKARSKYTTDTLIYVDHGFERIQ